MHQPLFSVLIANYNNGKYLMDAIESVRQQTYVNWEIILVDDSSTDNSHELYKELKKDERIHIYLNDQNRGCGYTKHRCAELANGELCGFLDPDDELLPNALLDSAQGLLMDEENVISFSRYYYCDDQMNVIAECRLLDLEGQSYFEHHDYCPEHFVAFRASAYKQSEGIDPFIKAAVDQDLYFKVEEHGKAIVIDKFTYKYRKNPEALTGIPYWCFYWNILVRHNVCIRRGLPLEEYAFYDFRNEILSALNRNTELTKLRICASRDFRLGMRLLAPIRYVRNLLKKHQGK